jgi:hypothetical protein
VVKSTADADRAVGGPGVGPPMGGLVWPGEAVCALDGGGGGVPGFSG